MIAILNGSELTTRENLHNELKEKLNFPDHYGENLDALWDCLVGWVDLPLTIYWENFSVSRRYLGDYADRTLKIFMNAEKELEHLKIEIK